MAKIKSSKTQGGLPLEVRCDRISPNPRQPRKTFDEDALRELADSIREHGIIQPLTVCPNGARGSYFLIAGERRWRAAQMAGLECVPVFVRPHPGDNVLEELALIENVHRQDLNPIEEALSYRSAVDQYGTITAAAARLGVSTVRISQRLIWLDLEPEIQLLVAQRRLPGDARAAKALLQIGDRQARLKLASRLAYQGVTLKAILAACTRLAQLLAEQRENEREPMLSRARRRAGKSKPGTEKLAVPALRDAAREMCAQCDVKAGALGDRCGEPAWALIAHAANDTCGGCPVREVVNACDSCPGVEMLRRIIGTQHARKELEHARA